jgi:hypothetical protein
MVEPGRSCARIVQLMTGISSGSASSGALVSHESESDLSCFSLAREANDAGEVVSFE